MILFTISLPLFGALIGGGTVFLIMAILLYPKKPLFFEKRLNLKEIAEEKLAEIDFNKEIDPLIDQHLDNFLYGFKSQLPLGGMFITSSLTSKIKYQAKEEIYKMLPGVKTQLLNRVWQTLDVDLFLKKTVTSLYRKYVFRLTVCSSVYGFLVGVIQACILWVLK